MSSSIESILNSLSGSELAKKLTSILTAEQLKLLAKPKPKKKNKKNKKRARSPSPERQEEEDDIDAVEASLREYEQVQEERAQRKSKKRRAKKKRRKERGKVRRLDKEPTRRHAVPGFAASTA